MKMCGKGAGFNPYDLANREVNESRAALSLFRRSATSRQACGEFGRRYRTLTRLFKLIATAPWQGRGNRAATAWEFRGVKWKPAGLLPGRAAPGGVV